MRCSKHNSSNQPTFIIFSGWPIALFIAWFVSWRLIVSLGILTTLLLVFFLHWLPISIFISLLLVTFKTGKTTYIKRPTQAQKRLTSITSDDSLKHTKWMAQLSLIVRAQHICTVRAKTDQKDNIKKAQGKSKISSRLVLVLKCQCQSPVSPLYVCWFYAKLYWQSTRPPPPL